MNRRIADIDGNGNRTAYRYDSRDLLLEQTDPLGKVVSFDYDVYGRRVRVTEHQIPHPLLLQDFHLTQMAK